MQAHITSNLLAQQTQGDQSPGSVKFPKHLPNSVALLPCSYPHHIKAIFRQGGVRGPCCPQWRNGYKFLSHYIGTMVIYSVNCLI